MGWTSWSESTARCAGGLGAVNVIESIARLLHSRIRVPHGDPFRRSELFHDDKTAFSNKCGESDGVSVVRCDTLSDDELCERSDVQANRRPGRTGDGAIVALVRDLRSVEVDGRPGEQVVFIYDDPMPLEPLHAIVRGNRDLDRSEQALVRDRIRDAFRRIIVP